MAENMIKISNKTLTDAQPISSSPYERLYGSNITNLGSRYTRQLSPPSTNMSSKKGFESRRILGNEYTTHSRNTTNGYGNSTYFSTNYTGSSTVPMGSSQNMMRMGYYTNTTGTSIPSIQGNKTIISTNVAVPAMVASSNITRIPGATSNSSSLLETKSISKPKKELDTTIAAQTVPNSIMPPEIPRKNVTAVTSLPTQNTTINTDRSHKTKHKCRCRYQRHVHHHHCKCRTKHKCIRDSLFRHLDKRDIQFLERIQQDSSPIRNLYHENEWNRRLTKSGSSNLAANQKEYLDDQIWKAMRDSPHTQLFYLYGPDAKKLPLWQAEQSLEPSKLSDGGFMLSVPEYNNTAILDSNRHYYSQCSINPITRKLRKMLLLGLKVIRDGTWSTRMSITDFHRLLYLIEHPVFNPSTDAFSKLRYRMACITKDHRNEIQDWIDREGMAAAVPESVQWLIPIKRYLRHHWNELTCSIRCDPNNIGL